MRILQLADQVRYTRMSTAELRESFLLDSLFQPGVVDLVYVDLDRTVIGSAVPLEAELALPCPSELRAGSFTERRELGVFNIGGQGCVIVDGKPYTLDRLDTLYIGRGEHAVAFASTNSSAPAEFYLLSYPAHAEHPTVFIPAAGQPSTTLGSAESANLRTITRLIHLEGAASCQLVMGFTRLASGSVWNTMPPHTHMRRSEIYFYFDLPASDRIIHLMGPGNETRNLVVANKQVAISPGWSIHAGVGTTNYSFCWGMGGENQVYSDMDALAISDLY